MVSIIVAMYNKAPYVERALRAIGRQSHLDYEIIVVDDGSTDGGADVVRRLRIGALRVISQRNAGPGAARNVGIAAARGQILAFLDADDEWAPDYLERSLSLLERYPEAISVSSAYWRVPPGRSMAPLWKQRGLRDGVYAWTPATNPRFMMHLTAFTSWTTGTVVRASAIARTGGFFERGARFGEDAFLVLKLMLIGPVVVNLEPAASYHVAASSLYLGAAAPREIDAFLQDPHDLYALCPPAMRSSLDDVLASFAFKAACVMAYWGRWRDGRALMHRFRPREPWRLPYFFPAMVSVNPLGSAVALAWRLAPWSARAR